MSENVALELFMHARRFGLTDSYIRQCKNKNISPVMAIPALVISAFSVELYLKCLTVINSSKTIRGHALDQLFQNISEEAKNSIQSGWNEYISQVEDYFKDMELRSGEAIPRDLISHLKLGSHAFPNLRYPGCFDKQSFFLGDLPRIIDTYIVSIKPSWKEIFPLGVVKGKNTTTL